MKFFIIICLIINSYNIYGANIGFSGGGGYFKHLIVNPLYQIYKSPDGTSMMFGLHIPIAKSNMTEFEFNVFNFWINDSDGIKHKGFPIFGIRFYLNDYANALRPSIHGGFTTIPVLSWNVGAALDFKIFNNTYIQVSSFFIYDGLYLLSGNNNPPSFINMSIKYYFKN